MEFLAFIWSIVSVPVIGLLVLSVLVFVHELGHFLVAKFFKVGVLEFAIGFGKKIKSFKHKETTYSLRLIPLGGYVRMLGDDPFNPPGENKKESEIPKAELQQITQDLSELDAELIKDRSKWFLTKPLYQRALVVLAGPLFNIIFALFLAIFSQYIYGVDIPINEPVIGDLVANKPADKAGILAGDRILEINGARIISWADLSKLVRSSDGSELNFKILRKYDDEKKVINIKVLPELEAPELALLTGSDKQAYVVGIKNNFQRIAIPFGAAVVEGGLDVWHLSVLTVKSFGWLIKGAISPRNIGGPITIVKESANSAKKGIEQLIWFMFFLSISLAILNLLPIPVLDGGHLLFYLIEAIKGSPVSLRVQQVAMQIGMFLLLTLMVFALGNDIFNLI